METKKNIFLGFMRTSSAYLQIDARAEGVQLPDYLMGERSVVLQLGYNMSVPILDLVVDDAGIRATLSFRRQPFACVVPWRAIYGISDGKERAVFPEDAPPDLLDERPGGETRTPPAVPTTPTTTPTTPSKKPRPSHLKLVK